MLSLEQQELLDRADRATTQRQIVVELELELADCKPTKALWKRLQIPLLPIETTDHSDPLVFHVRSQFDKLRIGMRVFAVPCDRNVLMDFASIFGICVQKKLSNQRDSLREQ